MGTVETVRGEPGVHDDKVLGIKVLLNGEDESRLVIDPVADREPLTKTRDDLAIGVEVERLEGGPRHSFAEAASVAVCDANTEKLAILLVDEIDLELGLTEDRLDVASHFVTVEESGH